MNLLVKHWKNLAQSGRSFLTFLNCLNISIFFFAFKILLNNVPAVSLSAIGLISKDCFFEFCEDIYLREFLACPIVSIRDDLRDGSSSLKVIGKTY